MDPEIDKMRALEVRETIVASCKGPTMAMDCGSEVDVCY